MEIEEIVGIVDANSSQDGEPYVYIDIAPPLIGTETILKQEIEDDDCMPNGLSYGAKYSSSSTLEKIKQEVDNYSKCMNLSNLSEKISICDDNKHNMDLKA